jgi:hypothetical protein
MYKIIGVDQKEYGPVTAEEIRQWISEGRLNAQTKACLEGTQDWKPLGMFPEFSFTTSPLVGSLPSMDEIFSRDYSVDILSCISRAWASFKNNIGNLVIATLLSGVIAAATMVAVWLILLAVGVKRLPYGQRPYLYIPVSLVASALVTWPVLAGFYSICLHAAREDRAGTDISNLFLGFKKTFSELFILRLVTGFIVAVCMLPSSIMYASKMAPFMEQLEHMQGTPPPGNPMEMILKMFSEMSSAFVATLPVFALCMIVATYLSVNWIFTLPLVVDKEMGFWAAMTTSWKIAHKHWFHIFGLAVLIGLMNIAGALPCYVGMLVTFPLGVTALMFAYEDIFRRKTS